MRIAIAIVLANYNRPAIIQLYESETVDPTLKEGFKRQSIKVETVRVLVGLGDSNRFPSICGGIIWALGPGGNLPCS